MRKTKSNDFTVVSNGYLRDSNLSLKAKGLFTVMLSLPKDWNFNIGGLPTLTNDGVHAVRAAVQELEQHGYLLRKEVRDKSGRIADTEYVIYPYPVSGEPYVGVTVVWKSVGGKLHGIKYLEIKHLITKY